MYQQIKLKGIAVDTEILNKLYGNRTTLIELSTSKIEDSKLTRSDDYIKRYRKLLYMESEFIMEISDSTAEIFTRFVRAEKQDNNYALVNAYFNGFKVGTRLMREFDNMYKEIEKQNTDLSKV